MVSLISSEKELFYSALKSYEKEFLHAVLLETCFEGNCVVLRDGFVWIA